MDTFKSFISQLYPDNDQSFSDIALELFRFQAENNPVYKNFLRFLNIKIDKIHSIEQIPFLPISLFKNHVIKTASWDTKTVFRSSGTTGLTTSSHHIHDLDFYHNHSIRCFEEHFGKITDYHILALLPSYLERNDSSLVSMIQFFIAQSGSPYSGFYLNDIDKLIKDIDQLKHTGKQTIVWGVTFALLDLVEHHHPDLAHCIILETGGMKGRRDEMTRAELHERLKKGLNVAQVYSEYGMTELLSQAYTRGSSVFFPSKSLKIIGRDLTDPLEKGIYNQSSGLNVIDLANVHSVAFIETEDVGKVSENGSFEVLGRLDNSDARGCNLMLV